MRIARKSISSCSSRSGSLPSLEYCRPRIAPPLQILIGARPACAAARLGRPFGRAAILVASGTVVVALAAGLLAPLVGVFGPTSLARRRQRLRRHPDLAVLLLASGGQAGACQALADIVEDLLDVVVIFECLKRHHGAADCLDALPHLTQRTIDAGD